MSAPSRLQDPISQRPLVEQVAGLWDRLERADADLAIHNEALATCIAAMT